MPTRQRISALCCMDSQGANVGGVVYSSPMPPFADTLERRRHCDIINYERSAWGNHGAPVTTQQVAAERAKGK